jgi:hypothetical protein
MGMRNFLRARLCTKTLQTELGIVVHTCNSSTWEAEAQLKVNPRYVASPCLKQNKMTTKMLYPCISPVFLLLTTYAEEIKDLRGKMMYGARHDGSHLKTQHSESRVSRIASSSPAWAT